MIRRLRPALMPGFAAAASLSAGLAPTLLDYGRFEPLDWVVPAYLAFAVMTLAAARGERRPGLFQLTLYGVLAVLPPLLVMRLAASVMPWVGIGLFVLLLGLAALLLALLLARRPLWRWLALALGLVLLVLARLFVPALDRPFTVAAGPRLGIMTALPLFMADHAGGDVLHGVGARAPVVRGLGPALPVAPVVVLDAATLRGFQRLLLAQPRLLSPAELVALDQWVRDGGTVTILADPLLRWPDERSSTDQRRPPLTSLLDPLLTHWGLTLEPASIDPDQPVERRLLSGRAMLHLAGASRFTLAGDAPCTLAEKGLIAYCRIGKGRAVLIADADWIDDRLWTLTPERPHDARGWTSDALPMLSHLIEGRQIPQRSHGAWLVSQDALISGLRWGFGLVLLLAAMLARFVPLPMSSQIPGRVRDRHREPPPHDST